MLLIETLIKWVLFAGQLLLHCLLSYTKIERCYAYGMWPSHWIAVTSHPETLPEKSIFTVCHTENSKDKNKTTMKDPKICIKWTVLLLKIRSFIRSISQYLILLSLFLWIMFCLILLSLVCNFNRIFFRVQVTVILPKTFSLSTLWWLTLYNYESNSFIFCIIKCLPRYFAILQFGHL